MCGVNYENVEQCCILLALENHKNKEKIKKDLNKVAVLRHGIEVIISEKKIGCCEKYNIWKIFHQLVVLDHGCCS